MSVSAACEAGWPKNERSLQTAEADRHFWTVPSAGAAADMEKALPHSSPGLYLFLTWHPTWVHALRFEHKKIDAGLGKSKVLGEKKIK